MWYFCQSISQRTFPDDWKYARATPLYRQDDRGVVNNYPPISLIPIVVKVLERIVYEQLYAYLQLEDHDILCQKLKNRKARVLTFSNFDADATELLEFLGRKILHASRKFIKPRWMFRCLQGLVPEYLYTTFTWRDSAYDLKDSKNKINVPLPRTMFTEKATISPHYVYSLPCDIRVSRGYLNVRSMTLFKSNARHSR